MEIRINFLEIDFVSQLNRYCGSLILVFIHSEINHPLFHSYSISLLFLAVCMSELLANEKEVVH